jgi:hypothetical protein
MPLAFVQDVDMASSSPYSAPSELVANLTVVRADPKLAAADKK